MNAIYIVFLLLVLFVAFFVRISSSLSKKTNGTVLNKDIVKLNFMYHPDEFYAHYETLPDLKTYYTTFLLVDQNEVKIEGKDIYNQFEEGDLVECDYIQRYLIIKGLDKKIKISKIYNDFKKVK